MIATDGTVRTVLTWARNYGEIAGYEQIASHGRKWKVTLPAKRRVGAPVFLGSEDDPC